METPSVKKSVLSLLTLIIQFLDFIFPKNNETIIFGSNGGKYMMGTPKALFTSLKRDFPRYHVYFFLLQPREFSHIGPFSFRSLLTFLRAKYIVFSHGLKDFGFFKASKRKIQILTWHGTGIKAAGLSTKGRTKSEIRAILQQNARVDACMVSSWLNASMRALNQGIDSSRMYLVGQARCDNLMEEWPKGKQRIKRYLSHLSGTETILLYAPTSRVEYHGGRVYRKGVEFFPFADFDFESFSAFLEENNVIVLVRAHSSDQIHGVDYHDSRILNFDFKKCQDIYEVLGDIDFLITDYSSLAYDFLLLNHPLIFIPYDLEEYQVVPGLIIDDYDFWMPGLKPISMHDLMEYVSSCIRGEPDRYREQREQLCNLLHSHQTKDSITQFLRMLQFLSTEE
jgi:CDP-glycerol glycerophosphotransferase (TagB/SpsB family)